MSPEELEKSKGENNEETGETPEEKKEKPKAKVVCAWCKKEMGEVEWSREGEATHSICPECRKKYFPGVTEKESKNI